jgi:hypothetical protein
LQFAADRVEQVLGVGAVDDGERLAQARLAAARIVSTRLSISAEARRVNVSNKIRPGATPRWIRWATRWASVFVLPVPAPAMISSGSSPAVAAARWASLSLESHCTEASPAPMPAPPCGGRPVRPMFEVLLPRRRAEIDARRHRRCDRGHAQEDHVMATTKKGGMHGGKNHKLKGLTSITDKVPGPVTTSSP